MVIADVNVLLYAMVPQFSQHVATKRWLTETLNSGVAFGTWEPILASVYRIATQPGLFSEAKAEGIFSFIESIQRSPNHYSLSSSPQLWSQFSVLALETGIRGRKSSDLLFAALAIENDATLFSYDRDFASIPGLRWKRPS